MKKIKVLFVGDLTYEFYVKSFYEAAKKVSSVDSYLFDYGCLNIKELSKSNVLKVEAHFGNGLHVLKLNRDLVRLCHHEKFDVIFLYSCRLIYAKTVKKIHQMGGYVAVFCNDDPFSDYYKWYMWGHYIASISYADITYVYRKNNIEQAIAHGAKKASVLLPYYITTRNKYIPDSSITMDVPDVVYIGHDEADGRREYIQSLLDNGIEVGLNSSWADFANNSCFARLVSKSKREDTENYNEILNKAKIAIVFLSSINHDTYTRRCFEIPATKTMMIAPYTDELASLFVDGKEAVFFRSKKDFVKKIKYYLEHEEERLAICMAGYERIMRDGHECKDRIIQIISDYKEEIY